MKLQKVYAAVFTADIAAGEAWYTKLLGRGPDNRPMETLVQWELFDQAGFALSADKAMAGKGTVFLWVDDLAAERRRLKGLGIELGDEVTGNYSTLAQARDPDGNVLVLTKLPSKAFPPA